MYDQLSPGHHLDALVPWPQIYLFQNAACIPSAQLPLRCVTGVLCDLQPLSCFHKTHGSLNPLPLPLLFLPGKLIMNRNRLISRPLLQRALL